MNQKHRHASLFSLRCGFALLFRFPYVIRTLFCFFLSYPITFHIIETMLFFFFTAQSVAIISFHSLIFNLRFLPCLSSYFFKYLRLYCSVFLVFDMINNVQFSHFDLMILSFSRFAKYFHVS